jgi:hypothetical protein
MIVLYGVLRLEAMSALARANLSLSICLILLLACPGSRRVLSQTVFATEAAFRAILLLFNLLAEFQRAANLPSYREPATIRTQVLTCGAILGRAGRPLGSPSFSKLGWLENQEPFAGQHLQLANFNFDEVGFCHRHLIPIRNQPR